MKKEEKIVQGIEFLKNRNFREAEDTFQLLIKSGENEPKILELKGDSLYGQVRIGYAQKCYHDAIDTVMTEIYDSIKSSKINDNLRTNYERLLKKLVDPDVRLYPEYDDLVSRIQKGEHPRLVSDLKSELENPEFELNYCGDYYTRKRNYDKAIKDELSIQIYTNKSKDSSSIISTRMLEFLQKNNKLDIDVIIPAPNHESDIPRICKGVSIALNLAAKLGKPCVVNALEKIEESDENRKNTGIYARRKLAKAQHKILDSGEIINKNILLVDDVLVSGGTVETCAKLLMDNGARHVDILCAGKSFYSPD